jgi:hypothetical protein
MVLDEVMADDRPDSVAALLFHTLDQFRRILGAAEVDTDDLLVDLRRGVATYTARAES